MSVTIRRRYAVVKLSGVDKQTVSGVKQDCLAVYRIRHVRILDGKHFYVVVEMDVAFP